jgi:hypothetical protein
MGSSGCYWQRISRLGRSKADRLADKADVDAAGQLL